MVVNRKSRFDGDKRRCHQRLASWRKPREVPSEGRGREFESRRARHDFNKLEFSARTRKGSGKQWVSATQLNSCLATGSPILERLELASSIALTTAGAVSR
jgi:hypothetical protein